MKTERGAIRGDSWATHYITPTGPVIMTANCPGQKMTAMWQDKPGDPNLYPMERADAAMWLRTHRRLERACRTS